MSYSAGLFNLQILFLLLQWLMLSFLLHSVVARKSCKGRNVALMVWWESLSLSLSLGSPIDDIKWPAGEEWRESYCAIIQ